MFHDYEAFMSAVGVDPQSLNLKILQLSILEKKWLFEGMFLSSLLF